MISPGTAARTALRTTLRVVLQELGELLIVAGALTGLFAAWLYWGQSPLPTAAQQRGPGPRRGPDAGPGHGHHLHAPLRLLGPVHRVRDAGRDPEGADVVIVPWLFRILPGPAWLRAALLLGPAALLGWALWEWGFGWLVQHFGSALDGDPTVGQNG